MTRRKAALEEKCSDLEFNLYRLRKIASDLEDGTFSAEEFRFLIWALRRIGAGDDPHAVLGIKGRRGQRRKRKSADQACRRRFAMAWIASAIRPLDEDGLGISLDDAFDRAAQAFGFSDESLRTYWNSYPEERQPAFPAPIHVLPIRRPE